ncbi:hypothetical protein PanWU01x14_052670 [Parasponia andersonii]|uniref:Uncharacterized protein n=1 Tax=Parasponia andersonii TaxID=3476 RepID=A0A2P5DMC9_PARAD|nr:hypothetical protein PanWU01x14_052670 [Parasponia andersonii]
MKELVQCHTTEADWVMVLKDENEYGHYGNVGPVPFQNQIYEGHATGIEAGLKRCLTKSPSPELLLHYQPTALLQLLAGLLKCMSGSSFHGGVFKPSAKVTSEEKLGCSSGSSVIVEISNLNTLKRELY